MAKNKNPQVKGFPVRKGLFVTKRLLHDQNVALYEKLDQMERSLSQQNLVLERILLEQGRAQAANEAAEDAGNEG